MQKLVSIMQKLVSIIAWYWIDHEAALQNVKSM